jgi:hypothetical protein
MHDVGTQYITPKPQNLANFGLIDRSGNCMRSRREKGPQAKSQTIVFIGDNCPTTQLLRNSVRQSGPKNPLICPLFLQIPNLKLFRTERKYPTVAVDRSSNIHNFCHSFKDQRLEEARAGFEQPRNDHVISEDLYLRLSAKIYMIRKPRMVRRWVVMSSSVFRGGLVRHSPPPLGGRP